MPAKNSCFSSCWYTIIFLMRKVEYPLQLAPVLYNSWSWNLVSSVSVTRISTVLSKAMNVQHAGSVVTFSAAID